MQPYPFTMYFFASFSSFPTDVEDCQVSFLIPGSLLALLKVTSEFYLRKYSQGMALSLISQCIKPTFVFLCVPKSTLKCKNRNHLFASNFSGFEYFYISQVNLRDSLPLTVFLPLIPSGLELGDGGICLQQGVYGVCQKIYTRQIEKCMTTVVQSLYIFSLVTVSPF